ncbi:MAG: RluA family pseudouridine synthase, partial [Gammaproteobacteria bacterium]|nr:RluA family pseudouridine synthase [Gammaproteobacteria bacterium]
MIRFFDRQPAAEEIPDVFPSPFRNQPHPLALKAGLSLQEELQARPPCSHDFAADGKMFGVLVVRTPAGETGFLAGFSGMLDGRWQVPGFVPPLFDEAERADFFPPGEAQLAMLGRQIENLRGSDRLRDLNLRLQTLRAESEAELAALREALAERKKIRRAERRRAETAGDQAGLIALSFESQRDRQTRRDLQYGWQQKIDETGQEIAGLQAQIATLEKNRLRLSRQ